MLFIAILLGIFVGVGIALLIVCWAVEKSNNAGDSKAKFLHFSENALVVMARKDNGRREFSLYE